MALGARIHDGVCGRVQELLSQFFMLIELGTIDFEQSIIHIFPP
jgi:hypothetical protein